MPGLSLIGQDQSQFLIGNKIGMGPQVIADLFGKRQEDIIAVVDRFVLGRIDTDDTAFKFKAEGRNTPLIIAKTDPYFCFGIAGQVRRDRARHPNQANVIRMAVDVGVVGR